MLNSWSKQLLLTLLLAMPVALYLFLQSFGENEYQIPILFEDGIVSPLPNCPNSEEPHLVKNFITEASCKIWDCTEVEGKLVVYSLYNNKCSTSQLVEVARVCNNFRDQPKFHVITIPIVPQPLTSEEISEIQLYGSNEERWSWWPYQPDVDQIVRCGFNLQQNCLSTEQVILVDSQSKIRGYYQATDPEEIDRLITEIHILLRD